MRSNTKTRVICLPHHYSSSNVMHCQGVRTQSIRCSQNPAVSTVDHPYPDSLNVSSAHPEYFDSVENRAWAHRKSNIHEYLSNSASEISETFDSGHHLGGEGIYSPMADSLDDLQNSAPDAGHKDGGNGGHGMWELYGMVPSSCSSKKPTPR